MDEHAFKAFYTETARALRAYVARTLGDRDQVDDVVQDSYVRLLRMPNAPDDPQQLRRLVFRIASNVMTDEWRRKNRAARAARVDQGGSAPSPDYARRLDMVRVFEQLAPNERQMMWLAYVEGESHAEIATALGLREGSIKVLLHRARRKLASLLK
jgi:RNA polymerase sigma-70 factor, ECF subfamily